MPWKGSFGPTTISPPITLSLKVLMMNWKLTLPWMTARRNDARNRPVLNARLSLLSLAWNFAAPGRLFERACARIFKRLGFLTTTFRLVAMLSMVARASAEPLDAVRICKIISVGATGMASFGASITSWQLDSKEEGNMALRVACPVLVSIFSVLYPLAFLTDKRKNKHRTRQFVEGIYFGGALCLIVLRLIRSSGDEKADDDKTNNIWLDMLTFCILMIVVAGILNAGRSLFTGSTNQSHNDANGTQLDTVGGPTGSSNNRRGRSDANAVNPVRNSPRHNGGQRDGQRDDSNNDDGIDYAGAAVNAADVLSA